MSAAGADALSAQTQVESRTTPSGGVIDLVRDHRCRVPFDQQSTHGVAVVSPYFRAYAGWVVCSRSGRGRTRCRRPNQARSERPEGCRCRLPAFGPRSSNCRATRPRASLPFFCTYGRASRLDRRPIDHGRHWRVSRLCERGQDPLPQTRLFPRF